MATAKTQIEADEPESDQAHTGWRHVIVQIKRDTTARIGMYIVLFVTLVAVYSTVDANLSLLTRGMLSDYAIAETLPIFGHPEKMPPPEEMDPLKPPAFQDGGSWDHPLGTDENGRDYFTRIVYGSRISITIGFVATVLGLVGGVSAGAVAGYYGGWVDNLLMRIVEAIYAIPALVLVIVFTTFVSGGNPDVQYAVIGVALTSIPVFARIIRSRVLSVREMAYVEAAKAAGVKNHNIIMRHVIPNSFAPVLVYATLQIGVVILVVASLSFLGYGAQPPTPDWGQMLNIAHGRMHTNPWISIWPGLAIFITIMGFNLFGDGLQDALDPRIKN